MSVAEQSGLNLTLFDTPKIGFLAFWPIYGDISLGYLMTYAGSPPPPNTDMG